uniref:Uncharacterized protein n=1 Tax=Anopheles coluzzii TaxID=1518534 RepID=A0A8W7PAK3_ANOCL
MPSPVSRTRVSFARRWGLVKSPTTGTGCVRIRIRHGKLDQHSTTQLKSPLGGVDAWCELPKAGAESGRVPALIGVDTALTEADGPWLLLALIVFVHWYTQERGHDGDERVLGRTLHETISFTFI